MPDMNEFERGGDIAREPDALTTPVDEVTKIWHESAEDTAESPEYTLIDTSTEYLASNRPRTSSHIDERSKAGKDPRRGQRRVLQRYVKLYDNYVNRTDKANAKTHQSWRSRVGNMLGEAYVLHRLSGDNGDPDMVRRISEDSQIGIHLSSSLGLGLLVAGQVDTAKTALLGSQDKSGTHVHNLLDAYLHTRDEAYRAGFVARSDRSPYLLARLVTAEQDWRDPDHTLLEATHDPV